MANITRTLKTQIVNVFGPSPANQWGVIQWGNGTWGMKSAGTGGSNPMVWNLNKVWTGSNQIYPTFPTNAVFKNINKHWTQTNTIGFSYANSSEQLSIGVYYYVFVDRVTNIESAAASPGYTLQSAQSVTYTSGSNPSTTWS